MSLTQNDLSSNVKSDNSSNRNLRILLNALLEKWWLIAIIGLVAGLAGIFYASKQKITYQSRLTFALDGGDAGGLSGASSLASQFGITLGSGGSELFSGDNILEIIKSRRLVEQTLLSVDTFDNKPVTFVQYYLDQNKDPNTKTSPANDISFPVGQPRSAFTKQQDSVLYDCYNKFVGSYIVADKPDRKYNIYAVNVTNPSEQFAKDFTDKLVGETNDFYIKICTQKAKQTLDILERRVQMMKGKVDSSLGGKAEIQDVNLNPAFSAAAVPILKEQTNIQVYGAAYAEMFKNLEIAKYQYLKQIPLMQIIDDANYPMKKIKMSKLKTAVEFAFVACFMTLLVLWIINLFQLKND